MKGSWGAPLPVIIVCVVFLLLCAGALAESRQNVIPAGLTSESISVQQTFWEGRIAKIGGSAAYEEFAQSVATLPPQQQHSEAHIFGGALYEIEGTPGLSVCDSRFSFGCFHEFLGRAIANLGLSVVTELNQGCFNALRSSGLSCQHGIGHGVLAYLGYTTNDLTKALGICKDLPYNDPIGGCYGGVFMEYNLQTMLGTDGHIRPATSDMQAPCDSVSAVYAPACYFWQPQWWRQNLREQGVKNNDVAYAEVGALCAQASAQYTRDCFEGIGNNIPADADFDGNRALELCIDATKDPTDQLYCRSLAADSLFVGGAGKTGDAMALCAGLTGNAYQYCAAYASNKANIVVPIMISAEVPTN